MKVFESQPKLVLLGNKKKDKIERFAETRFGEKS